MATDRKKLERGLSKLSFGAEETVVNLAIPRDEWNAVIDAAQKHLDTLPKPGWRVTRWYGDGSKSVLDFTSFDEAVAELKDWVPSMTMSIVISRVSAEQVTA